MKQFIKKNDVTLFFVIINIACYILDMIRGYALCDAGSLSVVDITERQEYYRIFTSMFLHAGFDHIWGNMIFLLALGDMLERFVGHARFFIIYMLSGIGGNLVSMLFETVTKDYYHTVGASGAIFGLIGALLILVIRNNGTYGEVSIRRLTLALIYMIYSGVRSDITNNAAHAGGFLTGLFLMEIFYHIKRRKIMRGQI